MSGAVLEYLLELWTVPTLKSQVAVSYAGLGLILGGEAIRKVAMLTAQSNFTHNIRRQKREEHELITHGVYRFIRHPGYLGWFIWALGTQLLLANPVCLVAFAVVAWRFFKVRIQYEEFFLQQFFGRQYKEYADKTPTWIPGIP